MAQTRLRAVHLRNIRPFRRNVDWVVPQSLYGTDQRCPGPRVVYGSSTADGLETTKMFLKLLSAAAGNLSKRQGEIMHDSVDDQNYGAAIILSAFVLSEFVDLRQNRQETEPHVSIVQGLMYEDGKTHHFQIFMSGLDYKLTFADVRVGTSYRSINVQMLDLSDPSEVLNTLRRYLGANTDATEERSLPRIVQVVTDEVHALKKCPLPNQPTTCTFLNDISMKGDGEGRVMLYFGKKSEDQMSFIEERVARFWMHLHHLCCNHGDRKAEIIIGLNNIATDHTVLQSLRAHDTPFIVVSTKADLLHQNNYQNISFIRFLYNRKSSRCGWTVSTPQWEIGKRESANIRRVTDEHNLQHVLSKELFLFVEGREDKCLIESWIKEIARCIDHAGSESLPDSFVSELDVEFEEVEGDKIRVIKHMLSGLQVVPLQGKGTSVHKMAPFMSLPVAHCICLDADAFFSVSGEDASASHIEDFTRSRKAEHAFDALWKVDLPHTCKHSKGGEFKMEHKKSIVNRMMEQIVHWTEHENTALHYPKLHERARKWSFGRTLDNDEDTPVYLRDIKCVEGRPASLTAEGIFRKCCIFGRLHTWRSGDGTSSKVINIPKNYILHRADDNMIPEITKLACCKYQHTVHELTKFVRFLYETAFQHYVNFNMQVYGGTTVEDEDSRPRVTRYYQERLVKAKVAVEIIKDTSLDEGQLLDITDRHATNLIDDITNQDDQQRLKKQSDSMAQTQGGNGSIP